MESKIHLPENFVKKMKGLLAQEYEAFAESYEKERVQGLRFNLLKDDLDRLYNKYNDRFDLRPIAWCQEGFYYQSEKRPGKHPLHEAGVYYIQEPSAMAVVSLLAPEPGDKVLDLCAAPGGKTTHAVSRMGNQGLLVSNEIHLARAKILSQNVERMGISNTVVTNEDSKKLAKHFPGFFDKIVVDAPCSGEGMFRKDEQARREWSEDNVRLCAARQAEILENASIMLKPGGKLVYSTCTFSPEENEKTIAAFLNRHPEFSVKKGPFDETMGISCGQSGWCDRPCNEMENTYRIWPQRTEGEGHFFALLQKTGSGTDIKTETRGMKKEKKKQSEKTVPKESAKLVEEFFNNTLRKEGILRLQCGKVLRQYGDQIYLVPEQMIDDKGLRILRFGLHIGTIKKNRLEPSHALSLALKTGDVKTVADFSSESEEIKSFLSGNTLPVSREKNGWILVCADGYSLGWGKANSGVIKNHYPKGLRMVW